MTTDDNGREADFYVDLDYLGNPIFVTDSYISSDGSWCEAISANYECVNDENQRVQVFSVIYYESTTRGIRTSGTMEAYEAYNEASGVGPTLEGAYTEIYRDAPVGNRIYLIACSYICQKSFLWYYIV